MLQPSVPADDRAQALATAQELEEMVDTRIFFGHQSVGKNIISGVPAVFEDAGVDAPSIVELAAGGSLPAKADRGLIMHQMVGQNRFPETKLDQFAATLRDGLGGQVNVAVLKFCYLDVNSTTDVRALFELYRSRMAELADEFPEVAFIYATVPLRTEPADLKQLVKEVIGRPNDNAAREQYNQLVRAEFGDTGRLFDIAAFQSTAPDGTRIARSHRGATHYALYEGYASDPGHLNPFGSTRAASEFLAVIGRRT